MKTLKAIMFTLAAANAVAALERPGPNPAQLIMMVVCLFVALIHDRVFP